MEFILEEVRVFRALLLKELFLGGTNIPEGGEALQSNGLNNFDGEAVLLAVEIRGFENNVGSMAGSFIIGLSFCWINVLMLLLCPLI